MKIQYASDLHLEVKSNSKYLEKNPLRVSGDILILAGDIHVFNEEDFMENPFWDWASQNYKQVICSFGNHEFYNGYDLSTLKDGFKYKIRDNVYYYYNCVIKIGDIDIIVSTLWSYIHNEYKEDCQFSVNDFKLIKYGNDYLTTDLFNKEHKKCFEFIKKAVKKSKAKEKIIVTHHVPSNLLTAKPFLGTSINEAFTVDLTDYLKKCGANYWIYGHSHRNIESIIGKTNCLCNQLGYVMSAENTTFDHGKYFELKEIDKKCILY